MELFWNVRSSFKHKSQIKWRCGIYIGFFLEFSIVKHINNFIIFIFDDNGDVVEFVLKDK